jgi:nitrite reductase/ring-hydroxylating ferredoxin subunit
MRTGWYQVAFVRELNAGVNPLDVERPLIAVREAERVRVFDAACPHRGAHLGHGGRIEAGAIVCQFHGHRIGLGMSAGQPFCVREYPATVVGGMVFADLADESVSDDLPRALQQIDGDHYYVAGFALRAPVPAELVIENGFDGAHFRPVHEICETPRLAVVEQTARRVRAQGVFVVPRSYWQSGAGDSVSVPYTATAFSPGIILSHLGGDHPYYVMTAATPSSKTACTIRLTIAIPAGKDGAAPDRSRCEYVLNQSRKGIEKDLTIWQHMIADAPSHFLAEDACVIAFRQFVARFAVKA